jgi:NADP-dependent 3-hydroxy acid dehydrogenase YdfG
MTEGIKNKVVVITGASSGLGAATARRLSAECARLVLGAHRTDRLEALAIELTANGASAIPITTDVSDHEQPWLTLP